MRRARRISGVETVGDGPDRLGHLPLPEHRQPAGAGLAIAAAIVPRSCSGWSSEPGVMPNGRRAMDDRTLRRHVLEELDFDPKVDPPVSAWRSGTASSRSRVMSAPMPRRSRRADHPVVRGVGPSSRRSRSATRPTRRRATRNSPHGREGPGLERPGAGPDDPGEGRGWPRHPRWLRPVLLTEGGRPGRRREARRCSGGAEPPRRDAARALGRRQGQGAGRPEADGAGPRQSRCGWKATQ